MTTSWRVVDLDGWAFDGPQVTLTYDADDPATIAIIEEAAHGAGVELERIEPEEAKPPPDLSESLE
jgi:hypothetical protein